MPSVVGISLRDFLGMFPRAYPPPPERLKPAVATCAAWGVGPGVVWLACCGWGWVPATWTHGSGQQRFVSHLPEVSCSRAIFRACCPGCIEHIGADSVPVLASRGVWGCVMRVAPVSRSCECLQERVPTRRFLGWELSRDGRWCRPDLAKLICW